MKSSLILRLLPLLISFVLFIVGCEKESGLPVDGDGNVYDTVVIGTQVWLKENLKTTKTNNGVPIPLVTDNDKWASLTTPAYCWYNNNPVYKENYGALYNWYAVRLNICPVGWHVPTKEEWKTLKNYLIARYGDDGIEIKDIKFWPYHISSETNKSGFSARPGGERDRFGTFNGIGDYANWWTFSEIRRVFLSGSGGSSLEITAMPGENGYSVRCVKNN